MKSFARAGYEGGERVEREGWEMEMELEGEDEVAVEG